MSHELSALGEKIFLDRYALKDMNRDSLAVGKTVIAKFQNGKMEAREVATVTAIDKSGVTIETRDGDVKIVPVEHLDIPIETSVEQMFARVAKGAAAVEKGPSKQIYWEGRFKELLKDFKFTPGGRILAALGTEQNLSLYNCFSGETMVTTKEKGSVPISTLKGDYHVWSLGGVWRKAEFNSYGVQPLMKVELSNGEVIHATAKHEWVVSGTQGLQTAASMKNRVTTDKLQGKNIYINPSPRPERGEDWKRGVAHGVVYGDGSKQGSSSHVILFKEKRELASLVAGGRSREVEHEKCGPTIRIDGLPTYLKTAPSVEEGPEYWAGFVSGLIATDGHVDNRGSVMLHNSDKGFLEFLRANLKGTGIVAGHITQSRYLSPYTGEPAPCYKLNFLRSSIEAEDLLRSSHRANWNAAPKTTKNITLKVVAVTPTDRVEEVFCCNEPETHTITVGNGILTGQCFVIPSPKDSRQGVMDCLSNMAEIMSRGGGVGINISSLRPRYAYVKGVNGRSSGAVSWGGLYSFVTGLIEQGGCLPYSALMSTDKGLIRAGDLADRLEAGEVIQAQTHQGLKPFTAVFRNGVKQTVRLVTERGIECIVSKDHKMAVLREGKMVTEAAETLQPGDTVFSLLGEGSEGEYVRLKHVPQTNYHNSKVINLPQVMEEHLAYVMGYYQANGTNTKSSKGISFSVPTNRPEISEFLVRELTNKFDDSVTRRPGDGKCEIIQMFSVNLYNWMNENGLTKDGGAFAKVPDVIMTSPSPVQAAFFAGWFDADGCDRGSKGGYGIDSISEDAVNGLQTLLSHNGIVSRLGWTVRPQVNWADIARLSVTGAAFKAKLSAWMSPWSFKDKLNPTKRTEIVYPTELFTPIGVRHTHFSQFWPGPTFKSISYGALEKIHNKLIEVGESDKAARVTELMRTIPDTLRSVDYFGEEEVVDFEVDGVHMLTAGQLYSSNSRRGALLLLLADWHPDVLEYINSKRTSGTITNANISVAISDKFMKAVEDDADWELIFPDCSDPQYDCIWDGNINTWLDKGGSVVVHKTLKAREVWDQIVTAAWASAEPGLFFIDRANQQANSYYYEKGDLICCNPCGEQPLPAWSVCNLGHINLAQFVKQGAWEGKEVDWDGIKTATADATRFLDNVIDATPYFSEGNRTQQLGERRVGLGTIGLAEMLIRLGIPYGSDESLRLIDKIYATIAEVSYETSAKLAEEKGAFPWCNKDLLAGSKFIQSMPVETQNLVEQHGLRNVTLLTQAPTGTVGTMIGTSTGIEPFYFWSYFRKGRLGIHEEKVNVYKEWTEANPELDPQKDLPSYFVNAMDLSPEGHVKVQAAIQRWVDSAISKTCNVPSSYTVEETKKLYELMHKLGCKGGTIYRDKSRDEQVLNLSNPDDAKSDSKASVQPPKEVVKEVGPKLRPRPSKCYGATVSKQTPAGTAHITMNNDTDGEPFEVFVDIGKGGSDIKAMAEGLGRLCSLVLRLGSGLTAQEKVEEIINQLSGIGGQRSIGFGHNRIKSLPDAVAHALEEQYSEAYDVLEAHDGILEEPYAISPEWHEKLVKKPAADLCPSCGDVSLLQIEGCSSCPGCGHSEC